MSFAPGVRLAAFGADGTPLLVTGDDIRDQAGSNGLASAIAASASAAASQLNAIKLDLTTASAGLRVQVNDLFGQVQGVGSYLSGEISRALDMEGTLHTLVVSAQSTADGNTSQIATETVQRAAADGALTAQINSVVAATASTNAAVVSEAAARATAEQAISLRIDTVTATAAGNSAAISSESAARVSAEGALSGRIDTVTATAAGNTAAITSEVAARSSSEGAISGRLDSVTASAAAANAGVSSESAARASADSALSSRLDTVTSSVAGNTAAISSESTTRASNDAALAGQYTSLSSTVGQNTAAISSEASTRASADGTISGRIDTVSSTLGGQASTIAMQASIIANLQGRTTTVWQVVEITPQGQARIALSNANGATSFIIDAANTYILGNLIVSGSVSWAQLGFGSLAAYVEYLYGGGVTTSLGSPTQAADHPLVLNGINPSGTFYLQYSVGVAPTTAVERTVSTYNGNPYYHDTVSDGSFVLDFADNEGNHYGLHLSGDDIAAGRTSGTILIPVKAGTPFNISVTPYVQQGTQNTGMVNEGDYYQSITSVSYSIGQISLKLKWTAL